MVRIQKLSLLFMLLFVTTFANAQELKYRLIEGTTDQLEVYNDNNTYFSGDIVIQPEAQYNGQNLPVNGIAKDAFKGSDAMTSISIPSSVKSIGKDAFLGCDNLKKAIFASIKDLCSMSFANFYANPLYLSHHLFIDGNENEVTTLSSELELNGVKAINNYAFAGGDKITNIQLPSGLERIGDDAFRGCNNYILTYYDFNQMLEIDYGEINSNPMSLAKSVGVSTGSLPDEISIDRNVKARAFQGAKWLKTLIIEPNVTSIGKYAFCDCVNMTSVTLSETLKSIGESAFEKCRSLIEITIPSATETIERYAFLYCTSLEKATIKAPITTLNEGLFKGCTKLNTVNLPKETQTIGMNTFYNTSLTSLPLPEAGGEGLKTIGESAFAGCKIQSLVIPSSIVSIDKYAFSDCRNLSDITISERGETLLTILEKAFSSSKDPYLLPNLEHIYSYAQKAPSAKDNAFLSQKSIQLVYPEGATNYDQAPWNNFSTSTIGSHTITYLVDNTLYKQYPQYAGLETPSVEDPVKEGWVFVGWIENIPELMPNNDLEIHGFFKKEYTTGDNIKYLLSSGLQNEAKVIGYSNPKQVTIPATVEYGEESFKVVGIEARAFKDATTLTTIDLSQANYMTSIGNAVFSGCTALESVIWSATLSEIKDSMFFDCTALSTFEIPATITAIGDLAFSNSGITAITLPKSINTMGTSVFKSCTNLENVEFEPGMDLPTNMLPDYTFYGCTKLAIFPTLPSSTTIIGKSAFEKCSSLNSLELNETELKIISNQAFYSCGALRSITLPATLESLGNKAFSSCQSVEKITINRSEPPAKENDSFSQTVYDGASLYVPNVDVYRSIDTWNLFKKVYPIEPQELPAEELEITLEEAPYTYTGSEITPKVTVKWKKENQEPLTIDEDEYEVVYENNIDAGENTATVIISDKEGCNYKITGSRTKEFTIDKAIIEITQDNLFIDKGEPSVIKGLIYDGAPKELIKAGTLKDPTPGTLEYSTDGETFTKEIPTETNAGTYQVYYRVKGDENHNTSEKSEKPLVVTIAQREKDIRFTLPDKSIFDYTYTGNAIEPPVTVEWKDSEGKYKSISNNEYEVNYSGNTDAGENTATVTVTDKEGGNFIVNGSKTFTITKANIALTDELFETPPSAIIDLTFNGTAEAFDGTAQKLINTGTLKNPGIGTLEYSLTKNEKDFCSDIPTGTDAGTYQVYYMVKGNNNYNNSAISESISVTISPKELTTKELEITLSDRSSFDYTYDGKAKQPEVTSLKYGGISFVKDKQFTVSYKNNVNVGTKAMVIITDKAGDNYIVNDSTTFEITRAASSLTKAPTAKTNIVYDDTDQALINAGASNTGNVQYSLSKDEKTFSETIPTGKNAGDYKIYYRVKGDANHSDTKIDSVKATIAPKEINSFSLSQSSYTYDGGEMKPTVTVTWNNMTVQGSEYAVSYSNNKNAGTATVTVTDKEGGNFKVSGSKTFTITPAALTISADNYEIFEGETIPEFTVKYDGFVNKETEAVLTKKPILRCSAIVGSKPGDYAINVSGAEAANYKITHKNGKLTILVLKFVAGGDTSKDEDDPATYQITSTGSDGSTTPTVTIIDDKDVGGAFAIPETVTYHSKTFTVTEIGANAFENNTNLSAVTIPSSITTIGDKAFKGCSNLKSITVYITTPISLAVAGTRGSDGASVFEGVDKTTCVLYVPDGSVDLYKAAPVWCEFKHIVPISTLTGISGVNATEGEPFDIYNLQGRKVKSKAYDLKGLPRGIYIINGKKVAVK